MSSLYGGEFLSAFIKLLLCGGWCGVGCVWALYANNSPAPVYFVLSICRSLMAGVRLKILSSPLERNVPILHFCKSVESPFLFRLGNKATILPLPHLSCTCRPALDMCPVYWNSSSKYPSSWILLWICEVWTIQVILDSNPIWICLSVHATYYLLPLALHDP